MDLVELRTALRSMIGDLYDDAASWDSNLLDAGLRGGLRFFAESGPVTESSLTVTTSGYEIDVSSLSVFRVLSAAYPWEDGVCYEDRAVAFRSVGGSMIRLEPYGVEAGEVLRLRYRQFFTIDGLSEETETTVGDADIPALLYASGSVALEIRSRRLDATPSAPKGEAEAMRALSQRWMDRYNDLIQGAGMSVVWGDIGL